MRFRTICACVVVLSTAAPSPSSTSTTAKTLFELSVSPRIASAPVVLTVRARLDPALRDAVCIVVSGEEDHSSCWVHEEVATPLVVRRFALEHAGEYDVVMRSARQSTTAVSVILN